MTIRKHFDIPKVARDKLNIAVDMADDLHLKEAQLIELLEDIDKNRYYVRYGYKSLMCFCNFGLRFSKTQSQRMVNHFRRTEPTSNIGRKSNHHQLRSEKPLQRIFYNHGLPPNKNAPEIN